MTPKEMLEKTKEVDEEVKALTARLRRNRRVLTICAFIMVVWWVLLFILV